MILYENGSFEKVFGYVLFNLKILGGSLWPGFIKMEGQTKWVNEFR